MVGRRTPSSRDDREIARAIIERAVGRASRPDRSVNLVVGAVFFLVGGGVVGWFLTRVWALRLDPKLPGFLPIFALVLLLFGGIGALGLSMVVQGARNRAGIDGFFYRMLFRVGRRFTPLHATLVPF